MKNNLKFSYNFEPYEETKELIYTKNNNSLYSKVYIDKIIHDLKRKGYNNSQIKNIMFSIENNNQAELSNGYITKNNKLKIINLQKGTKLKNYESFINKTDINKRKIINNYYNIKSHIHNTSEMNNKYNNDTINKHKSNVKINISQMNNTNFYISLDLKKSNNNMNNNLNKTNNIGELENKIIISNTPYHKKKDKNIFHKNINFISKDKINVDIQNRVNSFYSLKDNKNKPIQTTNIIKNEMINYKKNNNLIQSDNNIINIKKKKSNISISSINQNGQLPKNKKIINNYLEDNYSNIEKKHNESKYSSNSCQIQKPHKLNILSSSLLFQRRIIKNSNNNLNYKTLNTFTNNNKKSHYYNKYLNSYYNNNNNNPSNANFSSKNSNKYLINNSNIKNHNNHSFYNSSYRNLNNKKKHKIYSIENLNKENKMVKIYNYSFNNSNRNNNLSCKTKSFKNTTKKEVIFTTNDYSKINKNILDHIKIINKENKLIPMSPQQKEKNRNILNTPSNKNNSIYINKLDVYNETNKNKRLNKTQNIPNIYNYNFEIKNSRNNSENKNTKFLIDNKTSIKYLNKSEKKDYYLIHGKYYQKFKKKYNDGKYEGILINNKREIKGIMFYKNGSKYDGQLKNNKKHGKGIFTSQNYNNPNLIGIKYEGEFNNDKIEGYGVGMYSSGDKYEGEWKNNKQYGRGVLIYKEGGKYIKKKKNGKLNGIGIYYLKNGERYEGKFIDDKYNGYGKYFYNDGEYLEGIFKNDLPSGTCILHKNDGTNEERDFN